MAISKAIIAILVFAACFKTAFGIILNSTSEANVSLARPTAAPNVTENKNGYNDKPQSVIEEEKHKELKAGLEQIERLRERLVRKMEEKKRSKNVSVYKIPFGKNPRLTDDFPIQGDDPAAYGLQPPRMYPDTNRRQQRRRRRRQRKRMNRMKRRWRKMFKQFWSWLTETNLLKLNSKRTRNKNPKRFDHTSKNGFHYIMSLLKPERNIF